MQFYKAVSSANLEEVRRLVAEKNLSGILEKDEEKQTLLHTIVNKSSKYYESCREILKILLKLKKIDINAQDYRGLTALHCAAARGRIEMCLELLQQRGIKIDLVNNDENNALIFLCQTKYNKNNEVIFTIVLKLVLAEVDIDYKNKDGETALHFASLVGNTQAVNFLCSNNCNVDALNK
jgi:ankyrin repeat protein